VLTPKIETILVKHRCHTLLGRDTKEWQKYYSNRKESTLTSRIITGKHRSCTQLSNVIYGEAAHDRDPAHP